MVPLPAWTGDAPAARGSLEPEPHAATPIIAAAAMTARAILDRFIVVSFYWGLYLVMRSRVCGWPLTDRLEDRCWGFCPGFGATVGFDRNGFGVPSGEPAGHYRALDQRQNHVHGQSQGGDEQGSRGGLRGIAHGETVNEEPTEAAEANDRGDGGSGDNLQRRQTDPGHDQRQGTGELDVAQDFPAAHTHSRGRIASVGVDAFDARVGTGQDRWDGQDDEPQTRGR